MQALEKPKTAFSPSLEAEYQQQDHELSLSLLEDYELCYEGAADISQADPKEASEFAELIPSGKEVLDLGCAEGTLSVALALRGNKVTAADIAQTNLNKVRLSARKRKLDIELVKCDIEQGVEPFHGQSYDFIFLMDVIEHLQNPVKALGNIRKLMRKEGVLLIHTPNVMTPSLFLFYLVKRTKLNTNFFAPENLWDLHLQTYDYLSLVKTLSFVGLVVSNLIPTHVTIPLPVLRRSFKSKAVARCFPALSDTLLLECRKHTPIDVQAQVNYWNKRLGIKP